MLFHDSVKYLEKITNEPEHAKKFLEILDQSALQKKSYLERIISKEMKKEGKYTDKKAFKAELSKRVKAAQAEQLTKLSDNLAQTGQIKIGLDRNLDNKTTAEILNNTIDNYIDTAMKMQVGEEGLDFYKKTCCSINSK